MIAMLKKKYNDDSNCIFKPYDHFTSNYWKSKLVSVQFSHVRLFATPWTAAHQASLSIPIPRACSNSCPSSQWCHPTISSSVIPFSSCLWSFPALGSFLMSWFFASGDQTIGVSASASASASVLPMNMQVQTPFELTAFISLKSKGLSRVFCSTTVWKHHFYSAQPSLWSNSHICTWLLEKP